MSAGPRTQLRQLLNTASRSFVQKQFTATHEALAKAIPLIDNSGQPWWEQPVDTESELKRRILVLLVTYYATVWSNKIDIPSSSSAIASLDSLSSAEHPNTLLASLYNTVLDFYSPSHATIVLLPDSVHLDADHIQLLPPSLITALVLAGIKIDSNLQILRALIDAWISVIPQVVKGLLQQESLRAEEEEGKRTPPVTDSGILLSSTSSLEMSNPNLLASSQISPTSQISTLLQACEKVAETYALVLLTKLEEWSEARVWLAGQRISENGFLSESKSKSLTSMLAQMQKGKEETAIRQRLQEQAKHRSKTSLVPPKASSSRTHSSSSLPIPNKRKSSPSSSSLSGGHSDSSGSPPQKSKSISSNDSKRSIHVHNQDKQMTTRGSFARMRLALARFLDPTTPPVDYSSVAPYGRFNSVAAFLRSYVLRLVVSQVLGFVFFVLFVWQISKRKGRERMRNIWQKILMTVKLGTKTTSL